MGIDIFENEKEITLNVVSVEGALINLIIQNYVYDNLFNKDINILKNELSKQFNDLLKIKIEEINVETISNGIEIKVFFHSMNGKIKSILCNIISNTENLK